MSSTGSGTGNSTGKNADSERPKRPGLGTLGFQSFLTTQFLGAFNDNAFRFAFLFTILATSEAADEGRLKGAAQVLFALPFVFFAGWAGTLADRLGKSRVIVYSKVGEVVVMLLGMLAFAMGSMPALLAVLFLMSVQSTFFGPAKYGYVAETIDPRRLVKANGIVQMTTMVAIVAGQITGGMVYEANIDSMGEGAMTFVGVALLGTLAALTIVKVGARRPEARFGKSPMGDLKTTWAGVRKSRTLLFTMLGIGHFYMLSALLQIDLAAFGTAELGLGEGNAAMLVATAVVGIALGSLLAGWLSEGRVELGLVPLGALTMSLGTLGVAWCEPVPLDVAGVASDGLLGALLLDGLWSPVLLILVLGLAGGLFIVPLLSLLQLNAPETEKGRYLAFGNMVSFLGIGMAALLLWLPDELGMSIRAQFLLVAGLSLAGTGVSLWLLPDAFVRLIAWFLAHSVYRIRVLHGDRLPEKGGVLLVVNHVSWVDALILAVSARRKLHFLMQREYYDWPPTRWLFKLMGCIPIASGDSPEVVQESLARAGRHLDDGRVVVVFAEGSVTRLGRMLPLRKGYQRILNGRSTPIVPVHLGGLWGSIFSHERGRLLWKLPRRIPYPVSVTYGEPLPADSPPEHVRRGILKLSMEAWSARGARRLPLHLTMLRLRRRSLRRRLHEPGRRAISCGQLLVRSAGLARSLRARLGAGETPVGVLARPGHDLACTLLALSRLRRVAVPLDPRDDPRALRRKLDDVGARHVLLGEGVEFAAEPGAAEAPERIPLPPLAPRGSLFEWPRVLLNAVLPFRLLRGRAPAPASDAFAVIFPRAGSPVVLQHDQVVNEVRGVQQVLSLDRKRDGLLGVLTPASTYGQVMGLWLPMLSGARVAWVEDPEDGKAVGKLAQRLGLTTLPGTPELLAHYVETCRPDNFGSLRLVLSGAGGLDEPQRAAFAAAFGIAPLAAFTSTACSGLVSVNTPDVRTAGHYQRGSVGGSVGHPLPRVLVDVVDPESGDLLPQGETGELLMRGPGVATPWGGSRPEVVRLGHRGRVDERGFLFVEPGASDGA